MGIQDMAAALAARDKGIQQATEHCESVQPDWQDQARGWLLSFAALSRAPFTTEEAREWAESLGFHSASKRGWGGITGGLIKRGLLVEVGTKRTKASNGSKRATYVLSGSK